MREEIYELSKKYEKLKFKEFRGFKTEKNFGLKGNLQKIQAICFFIILLIILSISILLFKIKVPIIFPILLIYMVIYCFVSILESLIKINVNVKEKKLIIKKLLKQYEISFEDIEKIYLTASPTLKGIKSKIRVLYKENKKEKNLGIETLLFKTKDIKNFINQLEIEQLVGEENKGKYDKKSNVDETILSNFDLAILLIMGITILIDFAI